MTRESAILDAYALATNKSVAISAIPAAKRNLLTSYAIRYYREWQRAEGMEWDSLYNVVGAGTVTATDTFSLDTDIHYIADAEQHELNQVRVKFGDAANPQYVYYKTVKRGQLHINRETNVVAKASDNSIQFGKAFKTTDSMFGGTIEVPAIIKLDDINADTDEILIDDPNWLAYRVAAQYAYSYKSLRDMYDDLLGQANNLMKDMISRDSTGNETTSTGVDYFASMGNVH